MKRLRNIACAAIIASVIMTGSCQLSDKGSALAETTEPAVTVEIDVAETTADIQMYVDVMYNSPLKSLDHALSHTALVVDATVEEIEQFGRTSMRYKIRVNQSYYGKLDGGDILYVYAIREDFKVGKQFLMFLELNKQALYPHPIASLVRGIAIPSNHNYLVIENITLADSREMLFSDLKTKEGYDTHHSAVASEPFASFEQAISETGTVARVRLLSEDKVNDYASAYRVSYKGIQTDTDIDLEELGQYLALPPGLVIRNDYLIVLDWDSDGNPTLAGQGETIIEADSEAASLLDLSLK